MNTFYPIPTLKIQDNQLLINNVPIEFDSFVLSAYIHQSGLLYVTCKSWPYYREGIPIQEERTVIVPYQHLLEPQRIAATIKPFVLKQETTSTLSNGIYHTLGSTTKKPSQGCH